MKFPGIGKRLKEARGERTQKEWGKLLDVTHTNVSLTESEKSGVSADYLNRISKITGISIHWILTGEGPKYFKDITPNEVHEYDLKKGISKLVPREYYGQSSPPWLDSLVILSKLYDEGKLTKEEFDNAKRKILKMKE